MNAAPTLLAAWPFAAPTMLAWGAAAAIPILIHLWSRRRHREMAWAAMEFLLAALRKKARRMRIEQLILLAVRTLILALFALALADPVISTLPSLVGGSAAIGDTHHVLVIDGSYSMAARDEGGERSRFELSQELAARLVRGAPQGDGFTIVLLADPPRVVIGRPAFEPNDVVEEIEGLRIQHTGANLPATLTEIERLLRSAADEQPRLKQAHVSFFTDLDRTTWEDVLAADVQRRIGAMADRAKISMFDAGGSPRTNIAVTRLTSDATLATAGRQVRFTAELQSFVGVEATMCDVRWLVDGELADRQKVEVPAAGAASVSLDRSFAAPGEHTIEVRLEDDSLDVDNHRWISVPVREAIRVLCVRGESGATRHIALALEPRESAQARVRVDERTESSLLETDLHQYDCIVLSNIGRFGRDEARVLSRYVNNGGGLITFLGDNVQPASYNDELGAANEDARDDGGPASRVLPARIEQLMSPGPFAVDPLEYRHPIAAPFAGHPRSGLLTTPIWRYYKLAPYSAANARVALALHTGDPLLVEETIGRGRSFLVATAGSSDSIDERATPPQVWTAWSTWPSFPPVMQEMLALAVESGTKRRNVSVGEALEGSIHSTVANLPLNLVDPDQRLQRVPLNIDGEESRWQFSDALVSGVYRAEYGPPVSTSELYAVNVDPRESALERFDAELLPSQFRRDYAAERSQAPTFPTARGGGLFRTLLFGVLGLLMTESVLAWRFGRVDIR